MLLRDKNFVSETKGLNVIQSSIANLIDGDIYYFNAHIKGNVRIFFIDVRLDEAGNDIFYLCRDFTKFYHPSQDIMYNPIKPKDEIIKIITSSNKPVLDIFNPTKPGESGNLVPNYVPSSVVSYISAECAQAMAKYVTTYLDALQTT